MHWNWKILEASSTTIAHPLTFLICTANTEATRIQAPLTTPGIEPGGFGQELGVCRDGKYNIHCNPMGWVRRGSSMETKAGSEWNWHFFEAPFNACLHHTSFIGVPPSVEDHKKHHPS